MIELNSLYNEDCLATMQRMPDFFVDLTVTSPPYSQMRTYSGSEWSFEVFQKIAKELYRVTKDGGIVAWIVADQIVKGSKTLDSFRQGLYFAECGFRMHDVMAYIKSGVRNPSTNRYGQCWEYMFILSKGAPKTVNLIKDRKNLYPGPRTKRQNAVRTVDGDLVPDRAYTIGEYGARWNYWQYSVGGGNTSKDKVAFKHPALFPERLASDMITSWSNVGDLIYDPFSGASTTGVCAKELNRNFILSEISSVYCDVSRERFLNRFGVVL